MSLRRRLTRTVFTFLNGLRLALRKATGTGRSGVHAVPLTEAGRVVLIRLTYAPGWRVPGGGRKRGEAPEQAMLRELREEIGLVSHGAIEPLEAVRPGDPSDFFVVRDVVYRPRRSFEVDEVREFDLAQLPDDTTSWTAHLVGLCGPSNSSPALAGEGDHAKHGGGAFPTP
ncbi:MAG TPA: NUDIX domain-containing protein [Allosphingosinicella sp.]|jgi:8-oxo-dGTP pyrophosphatase MutT (NUDIX family)|nr:NUDIX domain-containing protein [Allosphingosinicella sp.]